MIFMNSEINEIDLEAFVFGIFKIPVVKLEIFRKKCVLLKNLHLGGTDFTETNF